MNRLLVVKYLLPLSVIAVSFGVQIAGPQITGVQGSPGMNQANAIAQLQEPKAPIKTPIEAINVVERVVRFIFTLFLALAVIFVIVSALLYLTAAGNTTRLDQAKSTLIYSIVAIVIALIAGGIANFVLDFLLRGGAGADLPKPGDTGGVGGAGS